ncbi:hypothetical protein AVEN_217514-1, partial [Araneus ventricosus]
HFPSSSSTSKSANAATVLLFILSEEYGPVETGGAALLHFLPVAQSLDVQQACSRDTKLPKVFQTALR